MTVSIILIVGFIITAVFSYRANYRTSLDSIEQVSALTTEGIYYQLTSMLSKPVNTSLTMAHDSLLLDHLSAEQQHLDDESYVEMTKNYLETYRKKYGFDSVFLVSATTGRYYNFNGIDRVLTQGNPENEWYFDLLSSSADYQMNVDNDEVSGADNEITVFVNCKVTDERGKVTGVVGVGVRFDHLKELLRSYEDKYNVEACLISEDGTIQISTTYTGYEKYDWFEVHGQNTIRKKVLGWKEAAQSMQIWTGIDSKNSEKSYIVTRHIPELSWNLVVERDTAQLIRDMRMQLYQSAAILTGVILFVLIVITMVIRNFNRRITGLMEEKQEIFKKATEQLYDNIYEINLTRNAYEGKRTENYFESLGAGGISYDEGLQVIAEKQIGKEYQDGYIATFNTENAIREYEQGNNHLRYSFTITQDGVNYHWMQIDAHIFYSEEDRALHMFTYRKNIDEEKRNELQAETDEMTGLLTKTATERYISRTLAEKADCMYAFFMFDIDNFKQANDCFGHAFGDFCIVEFARIIHSHFHGDGIVGRIGGDEFAAFVPVPDVEWAAKKGEELAAALHTECREQEVSWSMSSSIGIAISPRDGDQFGMLYKKADTALY